MDSETSRAIREAEAAAAGGALEGFTDALASRIGRHASAQTVFGQPVEQDGVTVIPVAKVRWGFGGGAGGDTGEEETGEKAAHGEGGGGGVSATPVGFIEMRDGEAEFKPIKDSSPPIMLILAASASAWLLLRGLRSFFR